MAGLLDPTLEDERMLTNLRVAEKELRLTPQEQDLYKRHLTNLWASSGVDNPDGSRSTLFQMVEQGPDGKYYNLPTVWNGAILKPEEALKKVEETGWDRFPAYRTPEEADARYQQMHDYMDRDATDYFAVRGPGGAILPQGLLAPYGRRF